MSFISPSRWLAVCAVLATFPIISEGALIKKEIHFLQSTGQSRVHERDVTLADWEKPAPTLYFDRNDRVEIKVHNGMPESIIVHWDDIVYVPQNRSNVGD